MRDATELEQLGDEIAEVFAHVNVRMHRVLTCIREFDAEGTLVEAVPQPPRPTPDLETALDAEALLAPWHDEPLDYGYVIDALMPADPH